MEEPETWVVRIKNRRGTRGYVPPCLLVRCHKERFCSHAYIECDWGDVRSENDKREVRTKK